MATFFGKTETDESKIQRLEREIGWYVNSISELRVENEKLKKILERVVTDDSLIEEKKSIDNERNIIKVKQLDLDAKLRLVEIEKANYERITSYAMDIVKIVFKQK